MVICNKGAGILAPLMAVLRGEHDGDRGRAHQHQDAGGVGAALSIDVRPEDERDRERDGHHSGDQGPEF